MLRNYKSLYISILFLLIFALPVNSQIWNVDQGFEHEDLYIGTYSDLYDYVEILYDSTGNLTYEDITSNNLPFYKNKTKTEFNKEGVYWLKTTVKGSSEKDGTYLFSIGSNEPMSYAGWYTMATWPYLDIYIQEGDIFLREFKSGFKRTPYEKPLRNRFSFFWLDLKVDEQKEIYARLDPDDGSWNRNPLPQAVSVYSFDPASLDFLDGTYTLRNFDNDVESEDGYPRHRNLLEVMEFYPDSTCNLSLQDVVNKWDSHSLFYLSNYSREICYWVHFNIRNPERVNQLRIFHFPLTLQEVECYLQNETGEFEKRGRFAQDALLLNIPPGQTLPVYFKYVAPSKSKFPILNISKFPILNIQDVYDKDYFSLQGRTNIKFLLLGALFLPFLFFLIQFTIQKDRLTLYYLFFLIGSSLYLISILDQIPFFAFNPKLLKTGNLIGSFYSGGSLLSFFGLVKFIHSFLNIQHSHARMYRVGNIILWIFVGSASVLLINILLDIDFVGFIFLHVWRFSGLIVFAYALFATIYGFFKNIKFSGPLLLAFSPLLVSGVYYAVIFLLYGLDIYITLVNVDLLLAEGFILTLVLFGVVIGVRNNAVKGEKIKMQEDMLALQEEVNTKLVKVDKLKDQFLANTSHELRTPLHGIIGLSESLYEREKEQEKRKELAMITSSGKRLSSLVNSILDFSKLKTHELQLSLKAIDLRTITDVVIQVSQPLLNGKPIKLSNEIDPSISLVDADEDRVYQIMHNLIGNAIKFTNDGSIQVFAVEKQDVVQVCVKDTGVGIPENKLEDIFKSFEQIDGSDAREQGGTGLGLTITKQLIELHGGNIWVESEIDKGTSVYFTLSKSRETKSTIREQQVLSKVAEPNEIEIGEEKQSVGGETISTDSRFKILIVDDESVNQQVLANLLTRNNFRILQAMNGKEALKIIEKESLDLVLLDIMMPKMSGYEVCREIRKRFLPSELPVIMITAKDQVTDLVEGLASGANDYLAKPFSRDELLARLRTHLNLYSISTAYLRFIPKEFIRALGHDSIVEVELGDQVQGEMTILFSDIRSFTTITEKLSASESFEFLNDFLKYITPAITSNGGFIDKYIGDAVMALFPYKPEDAIVAAIEAQNNLSEYNKTRELKGSDLIKIGIGIHTGPLMMGTIGVKNRMDGTVISDAVNLASRLEELNKHYGTTLIVSEDTLDKIEDPDKYHYRFLSKVRVRGKQKSNRIYEFFDGDADHDKSLKIKTLSAFNQGMEEYYNKRFEQASALFQEILDVYPEDKTAQILLEHAANYQELGVPENWDGVDAVDKVL